MVVDRNDPPASQAKGFQSDVVGVRAPSCGYDDLVYLEILTVEGCGDWPARHAPGHRRQLCLKVNLDAIASQRLRHQLAGFGFAVAKQRGPTYQQCYR